MIKKLITLLLASTFLFSCSSNKEYLKREDWEPSVKANLDNLISKYKNDNNYVVFDFDNTCSIFDVEEQLMIYQLQTLSFGIGPNEFKDILLTDLNKDTSINGYGYFTDDTKEMSYEDLVSDLYDSYSYLYTNYGPFNYMGVSEDRLDALHEESSFIDFSTKMMMMYDLVQDIESIDVAYPWILYWFSGLKENELYSLACRCYAKYASVPSESMTWTTQGIGTRTGGTSINWVKGVSVSENIKELYKNFSDNGIDVWVCSASHVDVIRAAIDSFGLHEYCTGVIGMNSSIKDGKIYNSYDYETGYPYYSKPNGNWEKMNKSTNAQTQGIGKVKAIKNTIYKEYNKGPIAGFMDSTGDYNFCTEFSSLKLAVCFNRANRKVTDGGGIIAPLAMYQKNVLKYDLDKANKNNDTLYLLQGRDENDTRTFRSSNETIRLGETNSKLYAGENNQVLYEYFISHNLSTEQIVNTFCIKTSSSELGFSYGFLNSYDGYHNI